MILTDQAGLFTADPRNDPAARVSSSAAAAGDPALERMAGGAGSALGRGGMITKVLAAKRAARSGASTVIASGREPRRAAAPGAGESIGTALVAPTPKVAARKQWMSDHLQLRGAVVVDEGAAAKLRDGARASCRSALSASRATFHRGDVIAVRRRRAARRSAAAWPTTAAPRRGSLRASPRAEIDRLLGFTGEPELIHRDNLVLA